MFVRISQVLVLALLGVFATSGTARADHIYEYYPNRGYYWMASWTDAASFQVASDKCYPREAEAYERVRATTAGYFAARWPSGIRMATQNCTGTTNTSTDIVLRYLPASNFPNGTADGYGGYNESILAPPSWCAIYSVSHPCGSHPSIVRLNNKKFTSAAYSSDYRRRLIMHETGHSLGLAHHCTSNSIMNDGTSGCNGGAWTNINGYQQTDRDGVHGIYPNWKY